MCVCELMCVCMSVVKLRSSCDLLFIHICVCVRACVCVCVCVWSLLQKTFSGRLNRFWHFFLLGYRKHASMSVQFMTFYNCRWISKKIYYIYIYIYVCVCVCVLWLIKSFAIFSFALVYGAFIKWLKRFKPYWSIHSR